MNNMFVFSFELFSVPCYWASFFTLKNEFLIGYIQKVKSEM